MKRSEMIRKFIKAADAAEDSGREAPDGKEGLTDFILEIFEKEGMLPPSRETLHGKENSWEPEQ